MPARILLAHDDPKYVATTIHTLISDACYDVAPTPIHSKH
jgi:hypothetical protein